MIDADDDMVEQKLTVTFDDTRATVESIKKALEKGGYPADGGPEFLNK